MTNGQILADLYRRLGYASSPDSGVTTRLQAFINQTHRQLLSIPAFARYRRAVLTFASVASSPFAVLPQAAVGIYAIVDRTNQKRLRELALSSIREADPGLTDTSSNPDAYAVVNLASPVARQPSDASQLLVDSDSASDTGTAYLDVVRTGGYSRQASVTMTGTTAVNLGPSDSLIVQKFYISAAAVGEVTLVEDASGGTELARIPIGRTFARYSQIHLYPTPSAAVTYHADVELYVWDMSNTNDEPLLPEDFHWLLVEGALVKEWTKKDDLPRQRVAQGAFDEGVAMLRAKLPATDDLISLRPKAVKYSQLGAYFEAGT